MKLNLFLFYIDFRKEKAVFDCFDCWQKKIVIKKYKHVFNF